jgi:tetratricopeptide (TPR) repeat protein
MPQATKIFRVFVSSTFSDMREERKILQTRVFPRLETYCRQNGAKFQAVDLRWGVNEESQFNQKTMDICLNEISRCQRISPKPNFIMLLGDRYGWQPVPYRIPEAEMEQIRTVTDKPGETLLSTWYRLDENAVPPEYVLQRRSGENTDYATWQKIEEELRDTLRSAVNKLSFSDIDRIKYFASATHQEIISGALNPPADLKFNPREHVFAYVRQVENKPEEGSTVDLSVWQDSDENSKTQLPALKQNLKDTLGANYHDYAATWEGNKLAPSDADAFADMIYGHLHGIIKTQMDETTSTNAVALEVKNHRTVQEGLTRYFHGRTDVLETIEKHLSDATAHTVLALIGESGSGKSSVMAQAIKEAESKESKKGFIFYRFLGTSSWSTNAFTLLQLLCTEIAGRFGRELKSFVEKEDTLEEFEGIKEVFLKCLGLATEEQPITLFLDALDQLSDTHDAKNLAWLPRYLPSHIKIVASSLPELEEKLADTTLVRLPRLPETEAKQILAKWLSAIKRKLTKEQEIEVLKKFAKTGLPIYLKLAYERARHWHSYTEPKTLPIDVSGALDVWFHDLETEHGHEELFVKTVFQYLLSGKYGGLTEEELLEILAFDKEYWEQFLASCHPDHRDEVKNAKPLKLPIVVWSRLYLDLEPYLTERDADGETIICFYHRKFNEYVAAKYLKDTTRAHKKLSEYYEFRPLYLDVPTRKQPNMRKVAELPWHLSQIKNWGGLSRVLSEPSFHNAAWHHNSLDVRHYWSAIEQNSQISIIDSFQNVLAQPEHHSESLISIAELLIRLGQLEHSYNIWRHLSTSDGKSWEDLSGTEKEQLSRSKKKDMCTALGWMGFIKDQQGDSISGLDYYEKQAAMSREIEDKNLLQWALSHIAFVYQNYGQWERSQELLQEQENLCKETNNRNGLQLCLGHQASYYRHKNNPQKALELLKKQEEIAKAVGNFDSTMIALNNQAFIYRDLLDEEKAFKLLKDVETMARKVGNKQLLQIALCNLGDIFFNKKDFDNTLHYYKEEEGLCRFLGNKSGLQICLGNLAIVYYMQNNIDSAYLATLEQEALLIEIGHSGHRDALDKCNTRKALIEQKFMKGAHASNRLKNITKHGLAGRDVSELPLKYYRGIFGLLRNRIPKKLRRLINSTGVSELKNKVLDTMTRLKYMLAI